MNTATLSRCSRGYTVVPLRHPRLTGSSLSGLILRQNRANTAAPRRASLN